MTRKEITASQVWTWLAEAILILLIIGLLLAFWLPSLVGSDPWYTR